jgi:hypothetical protein
MRVINSIYDITITDYIEFLQSNDLENSAIDEKAIDAVYAIYGNTEGVVFSNRFDNVPISVMTDEKDLSIIRLYNHILTLCTSYQRTERQSFEYMGSTYYFNIEKGLSVGETIETIEVKKIMQDRIDTDGKHNATWTSYLYLLAICCRKQDEQLPHSKVERELFLKERAQYFANIPFCYALDIDFFLTNFLMDYLKTQQTNFSFLDYQKTPQ